MDQASARKILALGDSFSREELQQAFIKKTKIALKNGESDESQLDLNLARDVLNEEIDSTTALVPLLTRELVKISVQQELISKRQEAKDEFSQSIGIAKNRVINRIQGSRDMAGLLSAISAGAAFLKNDIARVTSSFPAVTGGVLLATSAICAVIAFMMHRSAKRLEDYTAELNKILTRQRSIDRVLSTAFSDSDYLDETHFEHKVVQAIENETGLQYVSERFSPASRVLDIYRDLGLLPQRFSKLISHGFIEDYIDFLIKSEFVSTVSHSEQGTVFVRKKA